MDSIINLQELGKSDSAEMTAMLAELGGQTDATASREESPRWPSRFIAAGEKSKD